MGVIDWVVVFSCGDWYVHAFLESVSVFSVFIQPSLQVVRSIRQAASSMPRVV